MTRLETNVNDDAVVSVAHDVDKLGVDVPLGWPIAFMGTVAHHNKSGAWSEGYHHEENHHYRFRRTDLWVRGAVEFSPRSFATDRFSLPAMRFVSLCSRLAPGSSLDGSGLVVEAYPTATLFRWGFAHRGYKQESKRAVRDELVEDFLGRSRRWLHLDGATGLLCHERDHAFDALVCALIARTSKKDLVDDIPESAVRPPCERDGSHFQCRIHFRIWANNQVDDHRNLCLQRRKAGPWPTLVDE